ncbi:MAG: hypothetical protein ABEJ95_02560 [Candidatus Nanohalobium sp.]
MPGDIVMPPNLMYNEHDGGLADLTRLDKEVLGAFIVTDYEQDPNSDAGIAGYITLEVGDTGEVTGTKEADEILNEFSEQGDTSHRYFHTHPLGALELENANLEGMSGADVESWRDNQGYHEDEHWWHMIVYNSPEPGMMAGRKVITSSDWDLKGSNWSKDGDEWYEIGGEAYDELMDMGLEEIDPYEQATKVA